MKKHITNTTIILIYSLIQSFGGLAPEPYSDSDLEQYGSNPNFEATVLLNDNCSASRIMLDKNLPFDLYITAAHCLHHKPNAYAEKFDEYVEKFCEFALDTLLQEAKQFSNLNNFNLTEFIQNLADSFIIDGTSLGDDLELIEEITSNFESIIERILILAEEGIITKFPDSYDEIKNFFENQITYKEDYDNYESSKIAFIVHPSYIKVSINQPYSFDLALFTNFEKTEKPAYRLFEGQPETLLGKKVISVGITSPSYNEDIVETISKGAFDSIIKSLDIHETQYRGEPFMPVIDRTNNNSLHGLITAGDSGGSMLIKYDSNNAYYLCGVISGHADFSTLDLTSIYSKIPSELKTSQIHQNCERGISHGYCYGVRNRWSTLDLDFINQAAEKFLLQANQQANNDKEDL